MIKLHVIIFFFTKIRGILFEFQNIINASRNININNSFVGKYLHKQIRRHWMLNVVFKITAQQI